MPEGRPPDCGPFVSVDKETHQVSIRLARLTKREKCSLLTQTRQLSVSFQGRGRIKCVSFIGPSKKI